MRLTPRRMALSCAPISFFSYLFTVAFLCPLPAISSYACPLLQRRLCAADNATSRTTSWQCGDHSIRCSGSAGQIQFYGEGEWCTIKEFSYQDRVLVVQDPGVNSRLSHHDCGFVYSFASPAPPLRRPTPFQNSMLSGFDVFNCEVATYNFSKDVFTGAYGSTGCRRYDLYYAFENEGQQPEEGSHCAEGTTFFEWRLQFDESGRNLTVLSAGFSHQRELRPDCFSCRISRGDCSPVAVGNSTACSCSQTCSDASSKMTTAKMKIIIGAMIISFFLS